MIAYLGHADSRPLVACDLHVKQQVEWIGQGSCAEALEEQSWASAAVLKWLVGDKRSSIECLLSSSNRSSRALSSWGSTLTLLQLLCDAAPDAAAHTARKLDCLQNLMLDSAGYLQTSGSPGRGASAPNGAYA